MTKKSKVDEQIDSFFANLNPATQSIRSRRISESNLGAPPLMDPEHAREEPASSRKNLFIPIGFLTAGLLTTALVFARFQAAASTVTPPKQPDLILPGSALNTPYPPKIQDTQPPSVPEGLRAAAADPTTVDLAWAASSDNLEVVGYTIYRNGVSVATISGSDLTFRDMLALPDSAYSYALDAYDQAGNHSAISAPVQVAIPAQPGAQIFLLPSEDTYINAENPNSIYGTAKTLRIDASPDIHAYLRFVVTGLNGKTITRARLMLYTESGAARGIQAVSVVGNLWNELGTNYYNAPALGSQLAFSPPAESATWITLDVTSSVTGEGRFNFGIVTDSTTAVHLASRETGANSPKLSLDLR